MASALFRLMAALGRDIVVANTVGSFALLVIMVLGGFVISRGNVMAMQLGKKKNFFHDNMIYRNLFLLHQRMYTNGSCGATGPPHLCTHRMLFP